jgi:rRNA maturation protein Nop10
MDKRTLPRRILAALKSRASFKNTDGMHEYTTRETTPGLTLTAHPVPFNEKDRYTGGRFGWR